MVTLSVISAVTQPTEWVSPLTYPKKLDGSLHISLDPQDLKKAIIQEHYKTLALHEISHQLNDAITLSKLHTKDCFWSVHLNETYSYLTTLSMHKGRYWYLCMSFCLTCPRTSFRCPCSRSLTTYQGSLPFTVISVSPEKPTRSTTGISSSWWRLSWRMGSCLTAARNELLQCSFLFISWGMKPDPAKVQDLPTPNNQTKLQSFFGLINYIQPFIPGLAGKTMFLQAQLSDWDWNSLTDAAF